MTASRERLNGEIELLRKTYGELEVGADIDWVLIKQFPLVQCWNRESTELLIIIPPAYPSTPPDNFFVTNGLRLRHDGHEVPPGNYTENQSVLGKSWAQFSYHCQSWSPAPDPLDGDNLLTFALAANRRLKELN